MWSLVGRGVNNVIFRGILRTVGAAATAGIGWRLGTDAYDAVKKRIKKKRPGDSGEGGEEESDEDDSPGTDPATARGPRGRHGR